MKPTCKPQLRICRGCGMHLDVNLCRDCVQRRADWRRLAALTMRVQGLSLAEIGANLGGMSRERARQIVQRASCSLFRITIDGHLEHYDL